MAINIAVVIFRCTFGTGFEKLKLTFEKIKNDNKLTLETHEKEF
jgi:hypothetical protein